MVEVDMVLMLVLFIAALVLTGSFLLFVKFDVFWGLFGFSEVFWRFRVWMELTSDMVSLSMKAVFGTVIAVTSFGLLIFGRVSILWKD